MSSSDATIDSDRDDRIEIAVPLRSEFANTLRVVVSSIGADAGFSIDEIDDLRLAVSEVFNVLADSVTGDGARVSTSLSSSASIVEVELRCDQLVGDIELDPLARTILSSVVDRYDLGDGVVTLAKRANETARRPD